MDGHIKAVGVIHAVWAAMGLALTAVITLVFGGLSQLMVSQSHHMDPLLARFVQSLAAIGTVIMACIFMWSLFALVAGIALMGYQEWARWTMVVLSVLHLFAFPTGTIIGGYSLWVLLNPETASLFAAQGRGDAPTPDHVRL